MSLEMVVFVNKTRIPAVTDLQSAINAFGVQLEVNSALNLIEDSGFSPASINGVSSGFEVSSLPAQRIWHDHPSLKAIAGERDWSITLRWGGDMGECACVLGVSAALVKLCDAVAYYPPDSMTYNLSNLLNDLGACMKKL